MIDTIHARIIIKDDRIPQEYLRSEWKSNEGIIYKRYQVRNISIKLKQLITGRFTLTIVGSLSKFLYNTNLVRFTRIDTRRAIFELGELIQTDIKKAVVTRVDIGANITLMHPLKSYMLSLGHKSRYKITSVCNSETIYFQIGARTLAFYDKLKELNKYDPELRSEFASLLDQMNVLRYELRLTKLLAFANQTSAVTLKQLYRKSFYHKLAQAWYDHYISIHKNGLQSIQSHPLFSNFLISEGTITLGGIQKGVEYLEAWAEYFKVDAQKKSRAKKKMLDVMTCLSPNDFIKELDEKIKFEIEFYL